MLKAFACIAVAAMSLAALAGPVHAQYPERNITLIVPYGAGGGTDVTARMLARDLEAVLGKPVTVENRAGGGGWVGWGALAQANPDGYTIGYLNVPCIYAGYLDRQYKRTETLESFTPLMNHVLDYNVWAVKADSPFKSVKDVIEAAKKTPDAITVSAFGAGSDDHLAALSMQAENGIKLIIVHHKSTAEAKTAAARRTYPGARRQYQRGSGGGEGRNHPHPRRHGAGAFAFPAKCRRPSRSRASIRYGRCRAASPRPPACRSDVQAKLTAALEKTLTSTEHQRRPSSSASSRA